MSASRAVRDYMVGGELAVKSRIMFFGVELDVDIARALPPRIHRGRPRHSVTRALRRHIL